MSGGLGRSSGWGKELANIFNSDGPHKSTGLSTCMCVSESERKEEEVNPQPTDEKRMSHHMFEVQMTPFTFTFSPAIIYLMICRGDKESVFFIGKCLCFQDDLRRKVKNNPLCDGRTRSL